MKCLKPLRPIGPLNRPPLGVILSRDARFGQGVEQGGFANVGQTHDAAFQTHKNILVIGVDCNEAAQSPRTPR